MRPYFTLKISSREGMIFEGQAGSLTSYNDKGKFDILPEHANFISLIKKGLVFVALGSGAASGATGVVPGSREVSFDVALLRVRENVAEVYLGIEGLTSYK